jgi:hypothetical protein
MAQCTPGGAQCNAAGWAAAARSVRHATPTNAPQQLDRPARTHLSTSWRSACQLSHALIAAVSARSWLRCGGERRPSLSLAVAAAAAATPRGRAASTSGARPAAAAEGADATSPCCASGAGPSLLDPCCTACCGSTGDAGGRAWLVRKVCSKISSLCLRNWRDSLRRTSSVSTPGTFSTACTDSPRLQGNRATRACALGGLAGPGRSVVKGSPGAAGGAGDEWPADARPCGLRGDSRLVHAAPRRAHCDACRHQNGVLTLQAALVGPWAGRADQCGHRISPGGRCSSPVG